jgi:hypothetical protein
LVETTLALFLPQEGEIAVLGDVTEMVRADRGRGRTVNRLTESATRPLFQEELRPGNDEVVRWYWGPFHPTSLYG